MWLRYHRWLGREPSLARMRCLDEELGFFNELPRGIWATRRGLPRVSPEQILCELPTGEAIEEQFRVEEPRAELRHDLFGVV